MSNFNLTDFRQSHPWAAGILAASAALALASVIVLFGWNSFATTVLEMEAIRFKEALGLTLLLGVTGRLLSPARRRAHRSARSESQ